MSEDTSNRLQIALWSAQVLLAIVFGIAGAAKAFLAPAELFAKLPDLEPLSMALIRFVGFAELAASAGLILPAATRIAPLLTPVAASGTFLVMSSAYATHIYAGRVEKLLLVVALAALSAFVAWGRFVKAPIAARGGNGVLRLNLGPGGRA